MSDVIGISCSCGDGECTRGTPRPGVDVCAPRGNNRGNVHGHWFDDGQCTYCGMLDNHGARERFDHLNTCAFWCGSVCDCEWK